MNRREGVAAAGGIIIQAFPHAAQEAIDAVEARIKEAPPLSTLVEKMPIEDVVAQVLHGLDYKQLDASLNVPLAYRCPCTRERALAPLAIFPEEELRSMIAEGHQEVTCQFCGRKYAFSPEEISRAKAHHRGTEKH